MLMNMQEQISEFLLLCRGPAHFNCDPKGGRRVNISTEHTLYIGIGKIAKK